MGWKENNKEHAKIWNEAIGKIIRALSKEDLQIAGSIFEYEHRWLLDILPIENEEQAVGLFLSWLIACFNKNSTPLVPWYMRAHGENLSKNEIEVLTAGSESVFGCFRVEKHENGKLELFDVTDKTFIVETIDLPALKEGQAIFARLFSKGKGRYFVYGPVLPFTGDAPYIMLREHRKFRDSWSGLLEGFFKYEVSEGLSEKTSDRHTENVNLLMFYLEIQPEIDSFEKVNIIMLKTEFKKYVNKFIQPKPDLDKVYYSLNKFYDYLKEKQIIKDCEAEKWLKRRCE